MTKNEEMAEVVVNASFGSVFNSKTRVPVVLRVPNTQSWKTGMGSRRKLPQTREKMVSDLINHLPIHRSMRLDEIYPRILRELAEELTEPLFIIYQLTGGVLVD